jgi:hypothetical protein
MAVWYVALHRYEELTEYAKANGISWPMETTMEASFDTFATAVFLTESAYGAQVGELRFSRTFLLDTVRAGTSCNIPPSMSIFIQGSPAPLTHSNVCCVSATSVSLILPYSA